MSSSTPLLRVLGAVALCAAAAATPAARAGTCIVDGTAAKQSIDGFGFASVWSGRLSTAQNDILFGRGPGQLGFSLLRVRIDPNRSWADETANAAAAHARGAKVLGTPWSPPASMKTNNNVIHGSLRADQYAAYASYLNQAATSIGLDWVSLQNEPDWDPDYEGCTWTPSNFLTFMRNNAGAITRPIVMPEALGFSDKYSDPSLNDATAASRIAVVAGHFYGNGNYVHTNAISKGKRVWMTEYNTKGTDIATGVTIARQVSDAMNNQFNAYFWWWVSQGSQTTLIDGTTPRKTGYALGQFARFVRPGMSRIGTTYNPSSGVYVTAYKSGDTLVIVAINGSGSAVTQAFALSGLSVSTLTPVRTSAGENLATLSGVGVSGNAFTYALPGNSITTFSGPIGGGTTTYALNVTRSGAGTGTVTSSAGGIQCGTTCSAAFGAGAVVTLTATAASGSSFASWGAPCSGSTASTCVVTMTANQSVSAAFSIPGGTSYTLAVTKAGTGSGTVASTYGGIDCGTTCSASVASGNTVTLTAAPASGSTFAGWSGACVGAGSCVVTATQDLTVTATFDGTPTGTCTAASGGQSGNFNTTGAVCFTVSGTVSGWGCSNADGRTVTVNGTATTCGKTPLPGSSPYTFRFTAGTYPWASFYWW